MKSKSRTPPRDVGSPSSFASSLSSQRSPQPITDETAIAGKLGSVILCMCNRETEGVSCKSEQCKNYEADRLSDFRKNSTAYISLREPVQALSCSHVIRVDQKGFAEGHGGTGEHCLHSSTSCNTSATTCTHTSPVVRSMSVRQVLTDSEFISDGKPVT